LLKIHFYETKPPPLNINEARSKSTPKIWLPCVVEEALTTVIIYTPVIPTNAMIQPIIAFL